MSVRVVVRWTLVALMLALTACQTTAPTPTAAPTRAPLPTEIPIPGEMQGALVLRVIDGDTIVVELGGKQYRVRYIGIDTPETHHPDDGADYLGFEATEANRSFVPEGSPVLLQRDISETDIYGRLLRYVFVDDVLVNAELVRMGLARVLFYEPDTLYQHAIKAAEAEALAAKRGICAPPPTPPAVSPLLHKGMAWTAAQAGDVVRLRQDPARGEPDTVLPAGLQVRVADAFWIPEGQQWWYWIGVNGFNGWVTGESITRHSPPESVEPPVTRLEAYSEVSLAEGAEMRAQPLQAAPVLQTLDAGTTVQLARLSWEADTDQWWCYVESAAGAGWVALNDVQE
jgi:endonuclease YncB( thermonuclease family)